jgi:SRSO17 transposase
MVSEDLGDTEGVLIFDESGFVKKGNDSIGVSRQYCGNVGKVENCQVGVYAAYASRHGYCFLDNRLFIPEKWFGLDYTGRREKCRLSAESSFKTKCWRRLRRAKSGGAVPSIIGDWINISLSADYSKSGFAMFLNTVKCSSTL